MFKTLTAIIPTVIAGAISLAGCPPEDAPQQCERTVALAQEPDREDLAGMDPACKINVYMDPEYSHGGWPWRRCTTYWSGTFVDTGTALVCMDVDL